MTPTFDVVFGIFLAAMAGLAVVCRTVGGTS